MKRANYSELKETLDSYSSKQLGKYPHRYTVFDLTLKNNQGLLEMLEEAGYWKFAPNRSRKLIGYHCIVAFFCCRRDTPDGEGDRLQCHHLDGNSQNNSPSNLVYLTAHDHTLVTKFQRKLTKLKLKQFYKLQKTIDTSLLTHYNRRGTKVYNWARFIMNIICLTVKKSNQWLARVETPVIKIVEFVTRWLKRINWLEEPTYV